jgi:hypothetical protein
MDGNYKIVVATMGLPPSVQKVTNVTILEFLYHFLCVVIIIKNSTHEIHYCRRSSRRSQYRSTFKKIR